MKVDGPSTDPLVTDYIYELQKPFITTLNTLWVKGRLSQFSAINSTHEDGLDLLCAYYDSFWEEDINDFTQAGYFLCLFSLVFF